MQKDSDCGYCKARKAPSDATRIVLEGLLTGLDMHGFWDACFLKSSVALILLFPNSFSFGVFCPNKFRSESERPLKKVPEHGSEEVPEQGSGEVPEQGSGEVPEQGSGEAPEQGSGKVPENSGARVPERGSGSGARFRSEVPESRSEVLERFRSEVPE